jgi:Flp pilus assembly pilin Flp
MLKLFTEAQLRVAALWSKLQPEEGQTMAEYAVVLAVITLVVLGALTALSGGISGALTNVSKILP